MYESIFVGDVPLVSTSFEGAILKIVNHTRNSRSGGVAVRFVNAYSISLCARDLRYVELLRDGNLNFPDGVPVHWVMRLTRFQTNTSQSSIRGPKVFRALLYSGDTYGLNHFLIGSTEDVNNRIKEKLAKESPDSIVKGHISPPFRPFTDNEINDWCAKIQKSGANIVWVGVGTPAQDFLTSILATKTGLVCLGVGAAFDFLAGTIREAPEAIQGTGLEWLYRLVKEPRRLWRRYLVGNIVFLVYSSRKFIANRRVIRDE
jgi:N-acetylglucosaminyldiphosphoundecaprenol N-acetyl-beta-D-mannosaminyltransferase